MTKAEFLDRLRQGLRGIPKSAGEEIMADYEGHFADGLAAGRSEQEIAAALGDPIRLARELRANAGIQQWEEKRSPANAVGAVFAVLGLGVIDILILLPILIPPVVVIFVIYIVALACFFGGVASFVAGLFDLSGSEAFTGLALMAGSVAGAALQTLIGIGLTNALVWYARLHIKLVKTADGQEG